MSSFLRILHAGLGKIIFIILRKCQSISERFYSQSDPGAGEMPQWEETSQANSDDLSPVLGGSVLEGEAEYGTLSSDFHACAVLLAHTDTHKQVNVIDKSY